MFQTIRLYHQNRLPTDQRLEFERQLRDDPELNERYQWFLRQESQRELEKAKADQRMLVQFFNRKREDPAFARMAERYEVLTGSREAPAPNAKKDDEPARTGRMLRWPPLLLVAAGLLLLVTLQWLSRRPPSFDNEAYQDEVLVLHEYGAAAGSADSLLDPLREDLLLLTRKCDSQPGNDSLLLLLAAKAQAFAELTHDSSMRQLYLQQAAVAYRKAGKFEACLLALDRIEKLDYTGENLSTWLLRYETLLRLGRDEEADLLLNDVFYHYKGHVPSEIILGKIFPKD